MAEKNIYDMTAEELREMLFKLGAEMQARSEADKKMKVRNYKEMNRFAKKGQILFTGSSLMEGFPVNEYEVSLGRGRVVYNRGIGGTTTDEFLREIDTVLLDLEPSKVFINIGTNDINARDDGEYWQDHLLMNYEKILTILKERLPKTIVYMMAYYPVHPNLPGAPAFARQAFKTRTNAALNDTNAKVKLLAEKFGYNFIDVNDGLKESDGQLRADITVEGVHMYAGGYETVFRALQEYM